MNTKGRQSKCRPQKARIGYGRQNYSIFPIWLNLLKQYTFVNVIPLAQTPRKNFRFFSEIFPGSSAQCSTSTLGHRVPIGP